MISDLFLLWLLLCGILANSVLCWFVGKAIGGLAYAFACACSITRWSLSVGKLHGFKETKLPVFVYVPWYLVYDTWNMWRDGPGSTTIHHPGGTWEGIGKWTVFDKKDSDQ